MRVWLLLVAAVACVSSVQAGRILFLNPVGSKSHKNFFMGIVNALADHGHQITLVTAYKPSKLRENVREVVLPDVDISRIVPNLFEGKMTGPLTLMQKAPGFCSDALEKKEMQNLLTEEFDLVMFSPFFSDCFLSVVHRMKVPFIYVIPAGLMGPFRDIIGNPNFPSFVASKLFTFKHPMTFTQRAVNTLSDVMLGLVFEHHVLRSIESECRRRGLCPEDMPSMHTIRYNSSIALINSVQTVDWPPRPFVPVVVHVGGIHCQPPQPLPKDLEDWVKGAGKDGFIFFSLGSAVTPSSMPEKHRKILVEVFGSLKQRVLWKWDKDTMEDLPPNVRLGKWLPQQDILGDSRLRLFITHGGLHSTMESMYHGVPVLGMPVFGDQETNMREVESDGWGSVLLWDDLTPDTLKEKIQFVMTNNEFKTRVAHQSAVMKDQPQHPSEVAVYWVEYVMRHKGAAHLRCPALDMPWYKLYNVDVWASVAGVVLLLFWLLYRLLRALFRCLFSLGAKRKLD